MLLPADLPCGIVQTDAHGLVVWANDEVCRLVQRPVAEVLGRPLDRLFTNSSQIFLETHVRPLLLREGQVSEIFLRLSGSEVDGTPVLLTARSQEHPALGHVWILFESRQRSAFERELIQAREKMQALAQDLNDQLGMMQKLFTILGHDLRGPVGSVAQMIDLVIEILASGEPVEEYLSLVQQSTHSTYSLVENLLGWIEGQGQGSSVPQEPVLVRNLLQTVVTWLESQAGAKSITLEVDCSASLAVQTDRRAVETIVRNLASNAIKYSPMNQKVLLAACANSEDWSISVSDQGSGLSASTLASLFREERVDSTPGTAHEKGSGLGLLFCSDLAQKLGGRLSAENNPERGCTFRLSCSGREVAIKGETTRN